MRPWPDTLAGRTVALLIGMTLLLIVGSALLLHDERSERFDERSRFFLLDRVGTLVRVLGDADDDERQRILRRIGRRGEQITLDDRPVVEQASRHPLEHMLARKLARGLRLPDRSAVRVQVTWHDPDEREMHKRERRRVRVHDLADVTIAVRLWDDSWLNFRTERFERPPPWAGKTLQLLALLLGLLVVSGLFIARRMARPMAQLADAAERFGLGRAQQALPEQGPREIRNTVRAFNRMQSRLQRHIEERSQMLAAVAHDLRTPITTLRLRAEYIEDREMRDKTLATLAEMEAILSATLAFARDEGADEVSRPTDLAVLLQTLIDDQQDLGADATYQGPDRLGVSCRPVALKRAFGNLIDNALKYGECVRVRLQDRADQVEILIDDDGPGIPDDQLDAVLTPFHRVETSRSRETGGIGLGLAMANTIVLAHGGTLTLHNRTEGGLRVTVRLPH